MQNEYLDMINTFNENLLATAKRVGDLNMATFEKVAAKQSDVFNACLESSTKQYEVLTSSKDYKEVMTAQGELMKGCQEKMLANVRETAEMFTAVRDELNVVVEDAVKFTSDSVGKVSELATKKAA